MRDKISADPAKTQHGDRAVGLLCLHGSECTVAHNERPHFLQKVYGYLESESLKVGRIGQGAVTTAYR